MKKILLLMALAGSMLYGQLQTLTDTLTTPQGGTFSGTIVVTLNNPATAQPLYYSTTTLSGWQQTYTITSGAVSISLYANSTIVPTGTSYTARYTPSSGSAYSETWVVPVGATTIREVRSTTVPTPSVLFLPSQLRQQGATVGQGLVWNGAAYAPSAVVADPMTTTGDIITRSGGVPTRLGIGSTGQVLTVAGGLPSWAAPATSGTVTSVSVTTANGVSGTVATATSTPAISLSLGAITPTSVAASGAVTGSNLSGTNTGDQTTITGNAGTATALAANGANCAAGMFPLGVNASGASETCTALPTTITGTANQITASAATGAVTLSLPSAVSGLTSVSATTFTGALTGNASTATALAANPTDCSAGQFATTIAASGNLTCSVVALADVSGAVGGASAVAATQVLYGVSAGVAGSSSSFVWDNANTRLGLGTASPTVGNLIDARGVIVGTGGFFGDTARNYGIYNSGSVLIFRTGGSDSLMRLPSTGNLLLNTTTDDGTNKLQVAGSGKFTTTVGAYQISAVDTASYAGVLVAGALEANLVLQDTGAITNQQSFNWNSNSNVLSLRVLNDSGTAVVRTAFATYANTGDTTFGLTVASNGFKVDIAGSGTSGTLRVYDALGTIGVTQLIVRAGAGQSSTNLQTWQDSGGTTLTSITSAGQIVVDAIKSTTGVRYVCVNTSGQLVSQAAACVGT